MPTNSAASEALVWKTRLFAAIVVGGFVAESIALPLLQAGTHALELLQGFQGELAALMARLALR